MSEKSKVLRPKNLEIAQRINELLKEWEPNSDSSKYSDAYLFVAGCMHSNDETVAGTFSVHGSSDVLIHSMEVMLKESPDVLPTVLMPVMDRMMNRVLQAEIGRVKEKFEEAQIIKSAIKE